MRSGDRERLSTERSTHECVARRTNYSRNQSDLWRYLIEEGPAVQTEILDDDHPLVENMCNRGNLSNDLNKLADHGIVDYRKEGRTKVWYVPDEWEPDREKVIEETTPHDSVVDVVDHHWELVSVLGGVFAMGLVLGGYEWLMSPLGLGGFPELLVSSSVIGFLTVLGMALREVA